MSLGYIVGVGRRRRQHTEYRVSQMLMGQFDGGHSAATGLCLRTLEELRTDIEDRLVGAERGETRIGLRLLAELDDLLRMVEKDIASDHELRNQPACLYSRDPNFVKGRRERRATIVHEREHVWATRYVRSLLTEERQFCGERVLRVARQLPGFNWAYARGEEMGWWYKGSPATMQVDEILARAEELRTLCSTNDRRRISADDDLGARSLRRVPRVCRAHVEELRRAMRPGFPRTVRWEDERAIEAVAFALDKLGGSASWWRKACPPILGGEEEEEDEE